MKLLSILALVLFVSAPSFAEEAAAPAAPAMSEAPAAEAPADAKEEKKSKKDEFVLEVDLHIEKLVPNKRGLSNYDILNIQMETAKRQLNFAMQNRMPKVVFIHGVGEGVLKAELDFLLGRYDNVTFQDANFQKYGLGATEVYFKQNTK